MNTSLVPKEYYEELDRNTKEVQEQLLEVIKEKSLRVFVLDYLKATHDEKTNVFEPEELLITRHDDKKYPQLEDLMKIYRESLETTRRNFLLLYGSEIPVEIWVRTMAHLGWSADVDQNVLEKLGIKVPPL